MKPTTLFVPLLTAALASAHGFVASISINGKSFPGNTPSQQPEKPSIIREISDISPVKGANNPDVNCGKDATRASLSADANPDDTISFDWKASESENWPHNTGPMLTYMASCGDTPCENFDSTKARWFKIDQVGRKSDGGEWEQADLMKGGVASVKLPSNIAPGNYLIRHEIIALHLANEKGGAEFYPSCAQLKIGGNGDGVPKDSDLVSLPGAYSDNDPGIFDPDVFDNNAPYVFPGPKVASFISGGDSGSDSDSGSGNTGNGGKATSTYGSPRPASTSSASASSTKKGSSTKCRVKKPENRTSYARDLSAVSTNSALEIRHYPRHISRVMRNLAFGRSH